MEPGIRELLDQLPTFDTRSKLVLHSDVIRGLREKGWSYRKISVFLGSLGVRTSSAAIHKFVTRQRCNSPTPITNAKPNVERKVGTK